ncbi:MAG: GntR family transcriptional regulator [Clostridia bacterium]|nr:GntR family transcriptional regulator [Clostridia bacterium]
MGWKFKTGIPIYRQIVDLVEERILGGTYPAGGELPTVRDLAMELAVNPNTVQRAFSELDKMGVTESKRTAGRFVTADSDRLEQLRRKKAKSILRDVYGALKRLGIDRTEIESILQEVEHDSIL